MKKGLILFLFISSFGIVYANYDNYEKFKIIPQKQSYQDFKFKNKSCGDENQYERTVIAYKYFKDNGKQNKINEKKEYDTVCALFTEKKMTKMRCFFLLFFGMFHTL